MIFKGLSIGKKIFILALNKIYDEKLKSQKKKYLKKDFENELKKYCNDEEKETIETSLSDFISNYRYGRADRLSNEKSIRWRTIFLKYLGFIEPENNINNIKEFNEIFKKFEEYANNFEIADNKLFELLKTFNINIDLFLSSQPTSINKLSKILNSHIRLTDKKIINNIIGEYKLLYIDNISQKLNIYSLRIFKDENLETIEIELTQNNISEKYSINILLLSDTYIYLQVYIVDSEKIKNINYLIFPLPFQKHYYKIHKGIALFTDDNQKIITTNCVLIKIQKINKIIDGNYSFDNYPRNIDKKIIDFLKSNVNSTNYQSINDLLSLTSEKEKNLNTLLPIVGSYKVYNLINSTKKLRVHFCKIYNENNDTKIIFKTTVTYDDNYLIYANDRYSTFLMKSKKNKLFKFILTIYNRPFYKKYFFLASYYFYSLSTNELESNLLIFIKEDKLDNLNIDNYTSIEYSYNELKSIKEKKIYLFLDKKNGINIDISKCEDELHFLSTSEENDFIDKLNYIGYLTDDKTVIYKAYLTLERNKTYVKLELYNHIDNKCVYNFKGIVEEEKYLTIIKLSSNYSKINLILKKDDNLSIFWGNYTLFVENITYGNVLFYRIKNYKEFETLITTQIPFEINFFLLNSFNLNSYNISKIYNNISSLVPEHKKDLIKNLIGKYLLYAIDLPYMTFSILSLNDDLTCEIKTVDNHYIGFYRIFDNLIKLIINRKVTQDEIILYLTLQLDNSLDFSKNLIYGSYAGIFNNNTTAGFCIFEKILDTFSEIKVQQLKIDSEDIINNNKYKAILKYLLQESYDFLKLFGKNNIILDFENEEKF